MSRKVKYVVVHQDLFIPAVGSLGRTLTTEGSNARRDLLMYDSPGEGGLTIEYKNQTAKVPYGNIAIMVYAPDTLT